MKYLFAVSLLCFSGCVVPAKEEKQTNNQAVKLELLFEHDGVKVYRFTDYNRFVYYADARGSTQFEVPEGKNNTIPMQVQTIGK